MGFNGTLRFSGKNSHEYLLVGTHLSVLPTTNYTQGKLKRGDVVSLRDEETGQVGAGEVIGYVTGVTTDRFEKFADLIELGPSHLRDPKALIENLYEKHPDLPMDEWTFIAFRTYLVEVL